MTDNESEKTPLLRFRAYSEAWKHKKLGEVADIIGGGTPSTSIDDYWNGDIDWYSPMEIGEQIYVSDSRKKVTELGIQKSSAKILPVGTVLFTSRAGIGNTAILAKEGATNQGFQSIVPRKQWLDSYFIFSRTKELKRYGEVHGGGSTFLEVSGKLMGEMPISLPSLEEQVKIGDFFRELDNIISFQQRELELLQLEKQSLLLKMFPNECELVPELRFNGFTDAWEQRKLGDVSESFEYGLNASAKEYDGLHKYIRITDIDESSRNFNQECLTSPDIDFSTADTYILKTGDLLFARTGASVGKSYLYHECDGFVYYAGFLIRARLKNEYNAEFVFQYTLTGQYNKYIQVMSQRSGQPGVNAEEYSKFSLSIPNLKEQKVIGDFFSKIDNTITLHQRKLETIIEIKKNLLKNMFI